MGICEVMAKLLCRCSMLKSDDVRLRNLTATNRWCELCDLPEVEDARHMISVCPVSQDARKHMYDEIEAIVGGRGGFNQMSMDKKFSTVMGSYIDGLDLHQMCNVWLTCASYIVQMYNMRVKSKQGVG